MSKKRPYRLGRRASSVAETRRRIIQAATVEYGEYGIEGTSMQAVARRAEVASGTVLYHFQTPNDLAAAALATWSEDLALPGVEQIEAAAPLAERVHQLVTALYGLYDRSEGAYRIYQKSPDHPVLVAARDGYDTAVGEMIAAALGDRMGDTEAVQVVSVLIDPGFRDTLLSRGIDPGRVIEVAASLALTWLEAR